MAAPSYDELKALGLAELLALRPDLFANTGDVTDFLLAAAAAMADKTIQFSAEEFRKTFVDGATGGDLTKLANDHYNIQRTPAVAAQVTLQFERPSDGGGEPAGSIPAGQTVGTSIDALGGDVRFATDTALSFALGELGPKSVAATAIDTGTEGNVSAGEITRIIDDIGFDGTFTVTNPAPSAGGNDEETDAELRERIRNRPLTFRRATLAALETGAREVDTVTVATASEDAQGVVTVAVSDDSGNSTQQMIADVQTELLNWRAAGITVNVVGGVIAPVDLTLTLTLAPEGQIGVLQNPVIDAVTAEIAKLGIGETLYDSMIISAARNVDPSLILDVTITSWDVDGTPVTPPEVFAPASGQLLRAQVITVQ